MQREGVNMANPIMKKINVAATINQAVEFVQSTPCHICSLEGFCGVKYKGTCKVARGIRLALYSAKKMKE